MTETLVGPSRRNFVRAAAWTVPVVSIAAVAPAFAASPTGSSIVGGVALSAIRYSDANNKRHVAWDFTVVNGPVAIQSISIAFTYLPGTGNLNFSAFEVFGYTAVPGAFDTTWLFNTAPGAAQVTATHGPIAATSTSLIHTDFKGADNSPGGGTINAVATITYVGGAQTTNPFSATWVGGVPHTHP